jgi:hypothetical protein
MKTDNEIIESFWVSQGGKPNMQEDIWFYESDWNMLLPVCKKWGEIKIDTNSKDCRRYTSLSDDLDNSIVNYYDVRMTFNQLVKNVKWYNESKLTP